MSATIRRDAAHDGASLPVRAKEERIAESQKRAVVAGIPTNN